MDTQPRTTAGTVRTARTVGTHARRAAHRAARAMLTTARRHGPALAALALRPVAWLAGIAAVVLIGLAVAPSVTLTLDCTAPTATASAAEAAPGTGAPCVMLCDAHPSGHTSPATALVGGFLHAAA
ncbi:hypothetical protein [Nocardia sp. NPDC004711]